MFEKLLWDKLYANYERGPLSWLYHYVW